MDPRVSIARQSPAPVGGMPTGTGWTRATSPRAGRSVGGSFVCAIAPRPRIDDDRTAHEPKANHQFPARRLRTHEDAARDEQSIAQDAHVVARPLRSSSVPARHSGAHSCNRDPDQQADNGGSNRHSPRHNSRDQKPADRYHDGTRQEAPPSRRHIRAAMMLRRPTNAEVEQNLTAPRPRLRALPHPPQPREAGRTHPMAPTLSPLAFLTNVVAKHLSLHHVEHSRAAAHASLCAFAKRPFTFGEGDDISEEPVRSPKTSIPLGSTRLIGSAPA